MELIINYHYSALYFEMFFLTSRFCYFFRARLFFSVLWKEVRFLFEGFLYNVGTALTVPPTAALTSFIFIFYLALIKHTTSGKYTWTCIMLYVAVTTFTWKFVNSNLHSLHTGWHFLLHTSFIFWTVYCTSAHPDYWKILSLDFSYLCCVFIFNGFTYLPSMDFH